MDPRLLDVLDRVVPPDASVAAPCPDVAAALEPTGRPVLAGPLERLPAGGVDAVALLGDELSSPLGERTAEGVLAEAARVLRPGGLLVAAAHNAVYAAATGRRLDGRAWKAAELARALGQRGFQVELVCAPGAAATLTTAERRGRRWRAGARRAPQRRTHPELDRQPGLVDAAERTVAVGRLPGDPEDRSVAFFASLPRKVVAAAVVCRDATGRLLVVYDRFKRHWTIPGGVVDADEDPQAAAAREAWEEAGVRVEPGALLGVFAASWPDRLTLVYAAETTWDTVPAPVHDHEIAEAAWMTLDAALARLAPTIADQVRRCLQSPGGTWRQ